RRSTLAHRPHRLTLAGSSISAGVYSRGFSRRTAGSPGEMSTPTQAPAAYTGFDRLPVAGEYRHGSSGETTADTDPFHGDTLVEIPLAGSDDLDDACRGAQWAQRDWERALPGERA